MQKDTGNPPTDPSAPLDPWDPMDVLRQIEQASDEALMLKLRQAIASKQRALTSLLLRELERRHT